MYLSINFQTTTNVVSTTLDVNKSATIMSVVTTVSVVKVMNSTQTNMDAKVSPPNFPLSPPSPIVKSRF